MACYNKWKTKCYKYAISFSVHYKSDIYFSFDNENDTTQIYEIKQNKTKKNMWGKVTIKFKKYNHKNVRNILVLSYAGSF